MMDIFILNSIACACWWFFFFFSLPAPPPDTRHNEHVGSKTKYAVWLISDQRNCICYMNMMFIDFDVYMDE